MIKTLCMSCNRPAPEFDSYQEIAADILSQIAAGITIIRLINQGTEAQKKTIPEVARRWVEDTMETLHLGNDLREMFAEENPRTVHRDCANWKIVHRRVNALLVELDYMRRDLIGHFVPGGISQ